MDELFLSQATNKSSLRCSGLKKITKINDTLNLPSDGPKERYEKLCWAEFIEVTYVRRERELWLLLSTHHLKNAIH